MNKIGLDDRGMSAAGGSSSAAGAGAAPLGFTPGAAGAAVARPPISSDQLKAALKQSLEAMIGIARTGNVDFKDVRGLPAGASSAAAPAAPAAAPEQQVLIINDASGQYTCSTYIFGKDISMVGQTFASPLKYFFSKIDELSKFKAIIYRLTSGPKPTSQFVTFLAGKITDIQTEKGKLDSIKERVEEKQKTLFNRYNTFITSMIQTMSDIRTEADTTSSGFSVPKELRNYFMEKFRGAMQAAIDAEEASYLYRRYPDYDAAAAAVALSQVRSELAGLSKEKLQKQAQDASTEYIRLKSSLADPSGGDIGTILNAAVSGGGGPDITVDMNTAFDELYNITSADEQEINTKIIIRFEAYNALISKIKPRVPAMAVVMLEELQNKKAAGAGAAAASAAGGSPINAAEINAYAKRIIKCIETGTYQLGGARRATRRRGRRHRTKTHRRFH